MPTFCVGCLRVLAGAATVAAISSFFWRLFPLVRKVDRDARLSPAGYLAALGGMIAVFILIFVIVLAVAGSV